ncbi:YgjP-like metallopeptidase domain-containing protein [Rhodoferax antarcticus]|uniref:YgjP-like metallopeptidase domain-containing protein n=1 Tax=Rhodoferax antarcticus TaxID=81479 RepID=UPI002224E8CE|nr:YgjP-like metallopeptidase domain-containing protein [Rhodoferax antarcticus]MCW2310637.1 putative metal-dependent hydrolase [Rhodoferax antarcticus]
MNKVLNQPVAAALRYLQGYPPDTLAQVEKLLQEDRVADWLLRKYPQGHAVRTDRSLFDYMQALKSEHLRGAEPLAKVLFDNKLQVVQHALGTHTTIARVQGNKLKAKREIRVASLFKQAPPEFLKMIAVHELAHLKERAHDKAFYQLCNYMEPRYHQLEFEVRVYLTHLEVAGARLWDNAEPPAR